MPTYKIADMTADEAQSRGLDLADHPEHYVFHVVTWADGHSGYIADIGDGKWWTMAFNADEIFESRDACVAWLWDNLTS